MTNGFAPIRRGLGRHAEDGRMTPLEFAGYVMMIMRADRETGMWWGSARALSFAFNAGLSDRAARRVLEELERGQYIKRFAKPGAHGNYAILINRYECTDGATKGSRIDALNTTDWRNPAVFEGKERAEERGEEENGGRRQAVDGRQEGDTKSKRLHPKSKIPNPKARRPELFVPCIQHARVTWAAKFKAKPSWSGKDDGLLSGLLRRRRDLTLEEFKARWERYLEDDDRFVGRMGYSLAWFCSRFDAYAEAVLGGIPEAPSPY